MRAFRALVGFVGRLAGRVQTRCLQIAAPAEFEEGIAAYERSDYSAAYSAWRPLAEQGNLWAQGLLGMMYVEGQGVCKDHIEAVRWYSMAAAQGNASAQFKLGAMYFQGAAVQEDRTEALRLIRMSADEGYLEARQWLQNSAQPKTA